MRNMEKMPLSLIFSMSFAMSHDLGKRTTPNNITGLKNEQVNTKLKLKITRQKRGKHQHDL